MWNLEDRQMSPRAWWSALKLRLSEPQAVVRAVLKCWRLVVAELAGEVDDSAVMTWSFFLRAIPDTHGRDQSRDEKRPLTRPTFLPRLRASPKTETAT